MGGTWAIFQKRGLAIGCNTASKPSIWFHGKNLAISIHVIFQFCQFWLRAFFSFSPATYFTSPPNTFQAKQPYVQPYREKFGVGETRWLGTGYNNLAIGYRVSLVHKGS